VVGGFVMPKETGMQNRYGQLQLRRELENVKPASNDIYARIRRNNLQGPAAEFAYKLLLEFPQLSDYQLDRCIEGWLKMRARHH
jgi:hypothetical protein